MAPSGPDDASLRGYAFFPEGFQAGGEITRQPLWPPKPKELERVGPGRHGRDSPITTSRWMSGSRSVRPAVGGMRAWVMVRMAATASIAPAAPRAWPTTPLVEVTGGPGVPKTLLMASASAASFSGVDVPWALMWAMSPGVRPASNRAASMHAAAPAPPGAGAVMW